ncbi:MAG: NAD(P)(+) transhydrogenase (Re/Si-specific) subunit beta [Planctomyces sp.]|nr:NAD(P)(+) transhydrogenase (Re/Si-specific) subunit beta [Planctomyces sp.]
MIHSIGIDLTYLAAAVLFILGLKGMTHPRTAVRGNLMGSVGMLLAIIATLLAGKIFSFWMVLAGMLLGGGIGAFVALRVPMTSMPEMVGLLNGFGGLASLLVAGAEIHRAGVEHAQAIAARSAEWENIPRAVQTSMGADAPIPFGMTSDVALAVAASCLIGAVTFAGSLIAFLKLAEHPVVKQLPRSPQQQLINAVLACVCFLLLLGVTGWPQTETFFWLLAICAGVLGYGLTIGIGGADMPVVIALLNSYSGLAGAATGFVLGNSVLIIAGSLVGASGLILTNIMCRAMNRSLPAVLFGTLGPTADGPKADDVYKSVKSTSADEIAMLLDVATRIVIVPGYGMAVAQAQHAVRDLSRLLQDKGVEVLFGIHPVAGRMPGHMNILLAEADISYDLMKELDDINGSLEQTDVCLVIGANDTVNPDARTNPTSPIAGMPIINADRARTCIVLKRSLSPGFAGIPNPLFAAENCLMFYADGQKGLMEIMAALKSG